MGDLCFKSSSILQVGGHMLFLRQRHPVRNRFQQSEMTGTI